MLIKWSHINIYVQQPQDINVLGDWLFYFLKLYKCRCFSIKMRLQKMPSLIDVTPLN
ncbi:hypothetical protein FHS14_000010 [Paenibacillus baekrokdamisoli]|nr:hypothetical protein [Paenibacillus baekrokdamisoli]